jgi:hypothetical protein
MDEGKPAGSLSPRIRASLARFHAIRDNCGEHVQVRLYNAPPEVAGFAFYQFSGCAPAAMVCSDRANAAL